LKYHLELLDLITNTVSVERLLVIVMVFGSGVAIDIKISVYLRILFELDIGGGMVVSSNSTQKNDLWALRSVSLPLCPSASHVKPPLQQIVTG